MKDTRRDDEFMKSLNENQKTFTPEMGVSQKLNKDQ